MNNLYIHNLIKNRGLLITCLFVAIALITLAFQGVDVCDEGWYMSSYQQVFNAPETVEYNFVFWLTTVVGGVWYELFPNGGIYSFRVLTTVFYLLTIVISYKVSIKFVPKYLILVSLLMSVFVNNFGFLAFYYNHMSGFMAVLIVYFFFSGLVNNSFKFIFFAGLLTAINVFSRLPNFVLFAIVIVFPLQKIWNKELENNLWIKQLIFFFIGAFSGFLAVFLAMYALGHLTIFKDAVTGLFDKGSNSDSNHSISKLLSVYVNDYLKVFFLGIKVLGLYFTYSVLLSCSSHNKFFKVLINVAFFCLFIWVFRGQTTHILFALSLFGALGVLFNKKSTANFKLYAVLSILVMVLLPLGSDGGINNAGYMGFWFSLPLFFYTITNFNITEVIAKVNDFNYKILDSEILKKGLIVFVFASFFAKFYNISQEAYFDKGSRFFKTFSINNVLSRNIYTTKSRSKIINEVLLELDNHVKEDDYLLAYDNIPMLNFLTKTKPYMGISWVWVYDSRTFDNQIRKAESKICKRPIVVQQKFKTIMSFSDPIDDYMSEDKKEGYIYKKGRVKAMNAFLKRNNYKIIWSNSHFNIYKSSSL